MLDFGRETKRLKGLNQIVSPQDDFHVGSVGRKTSSGYFAHAVGVLELAQQKFLLASVAVKAPNSRRREIQVGDQNSVVGVWLEGEQMPLNFSRFDLDGATYRYETMLLLPMPRSITKLGSLPTAGKLRVV